LQAVGGRDFCFADLARSKAWAGCVRAHGRGRVQFKLRAAFTGVYVCIGYTNATFIDPQRKIDRLFYQSLSTQACSAPCCFEFQRRPDPPAPPQPIAPVACHAAATPSHLISTPAGGAQP
jgi:hypothetical protein